MAEFQQLAQSRRSVRRYRAHDILRRTLEEILACALSAPSPHNRQPARLALIDTARTREQLVTAMGERLRSDRNRDGDAPELIERDVARSRARLVGVPVLVLVALSMKDMDCYPDSGRQHAEYVMAVQATAMAGQNIALAAHAAGLASCWMCAPLFCAQTVRAVLGLPPDWEPQGFITIGYADAAAKLRPRKSLEDILLRF
ncbi:MAG: hypothetical protein A3G81_22130 [Betaproteobacteria bacterium RIFCSPLOWO2_12_FULL_65_14]|nr:MAG: hypothetical protein A3G81_22130 [Betaproteobacteria bacterium RIFCSPLOWO2_12_FULL_65_14]